MANLNLGGIKPFIPLNTQAITAQQVQREQDEPQTLGELLKDVVQNAKNEGMRIDRETAHIEKKMLGVKEKAEVDAKSVMQKDQQGKVPGLIEAIMAILSEESSLEGKKRKKKTKFEERLEELAEMEANGAIDKAHLSEEEQKELEKMYDYLHRIKRAKAELKQLNDQEEQLQNRIQNQFYPNQVYTPQVQPRKED